MIDIHIIYFGPKPGLRTHIVFLSFKKFDLSTEKAVLSFLVEHPYTIWVASPSGSCDVIFDIISKDAEQFDAQLTGIINRFGNNVKNYEILETVKEFYYNHNYLFNKATRELKKSGTYIIDETDVKILSELSQNARIKSTDIAFKLRISHDQVSHRIKNLVDSGYIRQFTVFVDFFKLGLSYYYIFLQFPCMTKENEKDIVEFLRSLNEVLYIGKNAGKFNFNVDVIVKDSLELKKFLLKIREVFGHILESKEMFLMLEQAKNDYFPRGIVLDMKLRR